ncbi:MAG: PAS domain S-box protein [Spirochaetes bacterium]|nr:PAS domain S-box protein [Spirochaetota bacterium]
MDALCKSIMALTKEGVLQYSLDNGKIINTNRGLMDILQLGTSAQAFLGKAVSTLLPADTLQEIGRLIPTKTEIRGTEFVYRSENGTRKRLTIDARLADAGKDTGQTVVALIKETAAGNTPGDDFDRRGVRFQSILEKTKIGFASTDIFGRLTFVNRALCRMTGYTKKELLGEPFARFIYPEDKKKILSEFFSSFTNRKETVIIEFRVVHKNGHPVWLYSSPTRLFLKGRPREFNAIIFDISDRKKVEERLAAQEKYYRALVDNSFDVIHVVDSNGSVRYVSTSVEKILGYRTKGYQKMNLLSLVHPDDVSEAKNAFKAILEKPGETISLALRIKHKNGSWRHIESEAKNFIGISSIDGIVISSRDVTEHKQVVEELRISEERFSKTFRASPDAMTISRLADGLIIEVNDMWEKALGYSRAESVGTSSVALGIWSDPAIRQKAVQQLQKTGSLRNFEADILRKTGEIRQVSLSSELLEIRGETCLLTINHDITERKRAEETLRKSEKRYRELADSITDTFFATDKDLRYTYWNKASEALTGIKGKDAIGKSIFELFPDNEAIKRIVKVYKEVLETKKPKTFVTEFQINGKNYFFEINAYSSIDGISVFTKDITERKQAEEELQRNEALLREAQRVAHIGHWELDPDIGTPVWSEEIFHIFGLDPAKGEPSFTDHATHLHPEDWPILDKAVRKAGMDGTPFDLVFRIVKPDGKMGWMHAIGTTLIDDEGNVTKLFGTAQDITNIKRAEEALRESEQRFKLFMDHLPALAFINDPGKCMVYANQKVFNLYQKGPDKLIGRDFKEINPPDHVKRVKAQDRKVLENDEVLTIEETVPSVSGSTVWQTVKFPIHRKGHPSLVGAISFDISERIRIEEKYRLVTENIPVAVYSGQTVGQSSKIFITGRIEDLTGFTADEVCKDPELWPSIIHPNDREKVLRKVTEMKKVKKNLNAEYRIITKDGQVKWIHDMATSVLDKKGELMRIDGFMEDITERKRIEEELRENEQQYRSLFENSIEGIGISKGNRIIAANSALVGIFGYDSEEELTKVPLLELVVPEDRYRIRDQMQKRSKGESVPSRYIYKIKRKDGRVRTIEISSTEMTLSREPHVLGTFRDITDKNEIEKALLDSEKKYRELVESINDVIFTVDATGTLTYMSPTSKTLSGYTPDEVIGKPYTDFIHPEDIPEFKESFNRTISGESQPSEYRIVLKNGDIKWVRISSKPITDGEKTIGLHGVISDITDQKKIEKALMESERIKNLVLNSTAEMFAYYDTDLRIIWTNRAAGESVGKSPEDLVGLHCYELWNQSEEPCENCPVLQARDKKVSVTTERKTSDGRHWLIRGYPILDDEGNIVALTEFTQDITKQKKFEETLRESEERYRSIFEGAANLIILIDDGGRILENNARMPDILGYSRDEVTGRYITELILDEYLDSMKSCINETLETGHKYNQEFQVKRKDGSIIDVNINSEALRDQHGRNHRIVCIISDITERKKMRDTLEAREKLLRQVLTTNPNTIFIKNRKGEYLLVNKAMAELHHTTEEEMIGKKDVDFVKNGITTKEEAEQFFADDKKVITSKTPITKISEPFAIPDGTTRYFHTYKVPFSIEGSEDCVLGISVDITDRILMEKELKESEERYALAQSVANIGSWDWNIESGELHWSEETNRLYGLDTKNKIESYDHFLECVHPDDRSRVENAVKQSLETGSNYNVTNRILWPDGTTRWTEAIGSIICNDTGKAVRMVGITHDITATKLADDALRESEILFRSIFEQAAVGIAQVTPNGRFIMVNRRFSEIIGYSEEELSGMTFIDITHPDDNDLDMSYVTGVLHGEVDNYIIDKRYIKKDGSIVWITLFSKVIRDENGKERYTIAAMEDITERKEAENALLESQKRYFSLFEYSPIALWQEDFSEVKKHLDKLKKHGVKHIEQYLENHPEIVKECVSLVRVLDTNKATLDQYDAVNKDHILADLRNIFLEETYETFIKELAAIYRNETSIQFQASAKTLKGNKVDRVVRWSVLPDYEDTYEKVLVSEIDITEQERIVQELERSQEGLRKLSAHLESVREEERKAISREIHDELGQTLTALKMDLAWLNRNMTAADRSVRKKIGSMNTLIDETIQTVKEISTSLRPAMIDDLGLPAAIEWYTDDFQKRTGIPCPTSIEPEDISVDIDIAIALYRILQEALTNVARHSKADKVRIILRADEENLIMRVQDNGIGITKEMENKPSALGLLGMRERVHFLKGSITISGKPSKGTMVRVSIPVKE